MPIITVEAVISSMPKKDQKIFLKSQISSGRRVGNLYNFCSQENWQDASARASDAFFTTIGEKSPASISEKIGYGLIALAGQNPHYKDGWKRCVWEKNPPQIVKALEAAVISVGDIALSIGNLRDYLRIKLTPSNLEKILTREPLEKDVIQTSQHTSNVQFDLDQCNRELEIQGYFDSENEADARKRIIASIVQRTGQACFREKLLEIYGNRCAITECDVVFALEAAHILPYKGEHTNDVRNGLLLRADIHTLFDLGKISINPENYCVMLSDDIRTTAYSQFHGKRIILPKNDYQKPDQEALEIHFKKSVSKGW